MGIKYIGTCAGQPTSTVHARKVFVIAILCTVISYLTNLYPAFPDKNISPRQCDTQAPIDRPQPPPPTADPGQPAQAQAKLSVMASREATPLAC